MFDPKKVRCLFYTHSCGGVRQAAEKLELNSSTVSRQIASLESEVGLALMQRAGRTVELTEVGIEICNFYREQQTAQVDLNSRLDDFRGIRRGKLRISIGEGFSQWLVSSALKDFQLKYPRIELEVFVHSTSDSVLAVLDDDVDIVATYFAPNDPNLVFHARSDAPICAIVHKDHPLTDLKRRPKLTDIIRYPLAMLPEGFGGRQITDMIARSENIPLRPAIVSNSHVVLRYYVGLGAGVFLLPYRPSPQRELDDDLVPLPLNYSAEFKSQTQIITRRGRHLTSAAREMLRIFIQTGEFEFH